MASSPSIRAARATATSASCPAGVVAPRPVDVETAVPFASRGIAGHSVAHVGRVSHRSGDLGGHRRVPEAWGASRVDDRECEITEAVRGTSPRARLPASLSKRGRGGVEDSPVRRFGGPGLASTPLVGNGDLGLDPTSTTRALLLNMTAPLFREIVRETAVAAGLAHWNVTPHVFRHSGPSHDHSAKNRSLVDIQRRGRWAAPSSVRRYEKASLVNARLATMTPNQILAAQLAAEELPHAVLSGCLSVPGRRRLLRLGFGRADPPPAVRRILAGSSSRSSAVRPDWPRRSRSGVGRLPLGM